MVELNGCNKLCVFLLSVIGLWPYGNKNIRLFKNIVIGINVWLCILVQVLDLTTMKMTLSRVLRNLTLMTVSMGSLVKYHTVWYQANTVKGLIDRIKFHFQTNNDEILLIMQKYNYLGKQLSTLFASSISLVGGTMMLCHLSPIILDNIAPLNESRRIKYPIDTEAFYDQEKHPIPDTFIYFLWIAILGAIYVATESLMIMICLHAASLFEVTSYYFRTAISIEVTDTRTALKHTSDKHMSYLIKSVIMHNETIQFCSQFDAYFKLSYTPLVILGVTSISINLYALSQSLIHSVNIGEILLYLLLVIGEIQYMFMVNFIIQYVVDGAANISMIMYISRRFVYTEFFTAIY
ncbi:uncharacterized protein LOC143264163 [Megachile rotundata]|uniref:uncharacterized protein LOC143264163 n=1 Tax=Megachile rotundata TaxID=143995 RepID=UPI003FD0B8D8